VAEVKAGWQTEIIPVDTLLLAYAQGVFPMADSCTGDVDWYSADPRGVINLDRFHIPSRLGRSLRKAPFEIRFDTAFEAVIDGCAARSETWISDLIRNSYIELFRVGHAHCVEAWHDNVLQGGLYGVALRGAFFGESMFYRAPNASKAALIALVERLREHGFVLLDTQMVTPAIAQFGAEQIKRREYLARLRRALALDRSF
jgi:leucyl/phenylalanyl-tRNA--protein transferase